MALDNDKHSQILIQLAEIKLQIGRLVSDAESEKEFRKKRNDDFEKRLRALEDWKSEIHGKLVVTLTIGGLVWTAIIAVVVKLLK